MNSQSLEIHLVPALSDNYIFILRDKAQNKTAAVDPGEATSVLEFLEAKGWRLDEIFLTHHHWDHINGSKALQDKFLCPITGPSYDAHRIPHMDRKVSDGDQIDFGSARFDVWHLPGHTLGHIAYVSIGEAIIFSGDVFFGMGCGRLFEGSAEQMYEALNKIRALPDSTRIYCAHEYTLKNAGFALQQCPNNQDIKTRAQQTEIQRSKNQPTVPVILSDELKTNPFLLARSLEEFKKLRSLRDQYQ